ncbi:hypothetical protein D9M70_485630 [compost metagenome]
MLAERTDLLFAFRMVFDQKRFGFLPGAATVLLDVPVMGADIGEEPFALRLVGNDAAVGQVGVVVDQHLADVEDDMANIDAAHNCIPCSIFQRSALKASGIA